MAEGLKGAEKINDGTYSGKVESGVFPKCDHYVISLSKGESVNFTVLLTSNGNIHLEMYSSVDEKVQDKDLYLYRIGDMKSTDYKNRGERGNIYIRVEGKGDYRLQVDSSYSDFRSLLQDNWQKGLLFIVILIIIFSILIISVFVFRKAIKLSITHGFESENDDCIKIQDNSERYDLLPIVKDCDGKERMVPGKNGRVEPPGSKMKNTDHPSEEMSNENVINEREMEMEMDGRIHPRYRHIKWSDIESINFKIDDLQRENEKLKKELIISKECLSKETGKYIQMDQELEIERKTLTNYQDTNSSPNSGNFHRGFQMGLSRG